MDGSRTSFVNLNFFHSPFPKKMDSSSSSSKGKCYQKFQVYERIKFGSAKLNCMKFNFNVCQPFSPMLAMLVSS